MIDRDLYLISEAYRKVGSAPSSSRDDAKYVRLVDRGDFALALSMLRSSFMKKFPNTKATYGRGPRKVYHGSRSSSLFTEFNPNHGFNIDAVFFSSNPGVASHWSGSSTPHAFNNRILDGIDRLKTKEEIESYAKKVIGFHRFDIELTYDDGTPREYPGVSDDLGWSPNVMKGNIRVDPLEMAKDMLRNKAKRMLRSEVSTDLGFYQHFTYECYLNLENPLIIDAKERPYYDIVYNGTDGHTTEDIFVNMDNSYDGLIVFNVKETDYANRLTDDYIVKRANQIKSCDITFDNEGNLIPLSQRFNPMNNDIRY